MCGGNYLRWQTPRQLTKINNESIVARTIRLLKQCGVEDIAISSNDSRFDQFDVPVLHHNNPWEVFGINNSKGAWTDGFYPTQEPVCYLFGDVVFSKKAIQTIIQTETDDIEFFASAPPFAPEYIKPYAEPFAFKVVNLQHFWESIEKFKIYKYSRKFYRDPMSWELWQIIKNTPLNNIDYTNYTVINDYTCDIDHPKDIIKIQSKIKER